MSAKPRFPQPHTIRITQYRDPTWARVLDLWFDEDLAGVDENVFSYDMYDSGEYSNGSMPHLNNFVESRHDFVERSNRNNIERQRDRIAKYQEQDEEEYQRRAAAFRLAGTARGV